MTPIQESRERTIVQTAHRSSQPIPGHRAGFAPFRASLRDGSGCFFLVFILFGLAMLLFGLAGTVGPYRDALRADGGDLRIFPGALGMGSVIVLLVLRAYQLNLTEVGHQLRREGSGVDKDHPWTADYPWQPAGQDPDGVTSIAGGILGRIGFLGFIAILNAVGFSLGMPFLMVALVMDLLGLLVLYDSLQKLWQGLRFSRGRIVWLTFPAFTGSRLEAGFRTRRRLHVTGPVRVTLRCVEDGWTERQGKVRPRPVVYRIYQQETEIPLADDQSSLDSVRIDLAIPADLPGTDLNRAAPVYWQLLVRVPVLGPDFEAVFLAPVYEGRGGGA